MDQQTFEHNFTALSATDFIMTYDWMGAEGGLKLSPTELRLYSLIYSYSGDVACGRHYRGSLDYAAARLNTSRSSLCNAFRSLIKKGLIIVYGYIHTRGSKRPVYVADPAMADAAKKRFEQYWQSEGRARPRTYESYDFEPAFEPLVNKQPIAKEDKEAQLALVESPDENVSDDLAKDNLVQNLDLVPEGDNNLVQKLDLVEGNLVQNLDSYNKDIDNKEIHPSNTKEVASVQETEVDPSDGRMDLDNSDEDQDTKSDPFETLTSLARNQNLLHNDEGIAKTKNAYLRLINLGYEPEEIVDRWKVRVQTERYQGRNPKFCKQLCSWLTNDAAAEIEARRNIKQERQASTVTDRDYAIEEQLRDNDPEYEAMCREYHTVLTESVANQVKNPDKAKELRNKANELHERNQAYLNCALATAMKG